MANMVRCRNCSAYWDASDQVAAPDAAVAAPDAAAMRTQHMFAGVRELDVPTRMWLEQLLANVLPVVEPIVEGWLRRLMAKL
jgi:hypothetical protein